VTPSPYIAKEEHLMNKAKDDQDKDAEDQMRQFPPGSDVESDLHPEAIDEAANNPPPRGRRQPTKAGAAAERQGRTTQEGTAERTR